MSEALYESLMLNEVLKHIEQRQRFALTSHARPDGDAVSSTLALGEILRQMGKQTDIVLHDGVPRVYQQLPFVETVIEDGPHRRQLRRCHPSRMRRHSAHPAGRPRTAVPD